MYMPAIFNATLKHKVTKSLDDLTSRRLCDFFVQIFVSLRHYAVSPLCLYPIKIMIKKNAFSILIALIIMYLSLANSHTFDSVTIFNSIPNFDKFVHVGMYFGFMSVIILEHRNSIHNLRQLLMVGLIPAFYGILMEIFQATLTQTRTGSVFDELADCVGILISIFIWLWFNQSKKIKSDNY